MAVRLPAELLERDPAVLATAASLRYVPDDEPGITRRGRGTGFQFVGPDGATVTGAERDRLLALAVPPAWTEVWLSPHPDGHLQATGRDDAGRKQYRYHDDFRAFCEARKFRRLGYFPRALKLLREDIRAGLDAPVGHRRHSIAAALALIDHGMLRVGNEQSADDGVHGATTLEVEHLTDEADAIALEFTGKGGADRTVLVDVPDIADALRALAADADDRLFWFEDEHGRRAVRSHDLNQRIADIAGVGFSAKDLRTWGGTVTALGARLDGATELEAVDAAAERLGNTRAVCRASYVHPTVLTAPDEQLADLHARSRVSRWLTRLESTAAKLIDTDADAIAA